MARHGRHRGERLPLVAHDESRSRYAEVRLSIEIIDGAPSAALTAATTTSDLIVTGAHRRRDGRLGMRPGPIVHTLLHHADCPVAVVPRA